MCNNSAVTQKISGWLMDIEVGCIRGWFCFKDDELFATGGSDKVGKWKKYIFDDNGEIYVNRVGGK